MAEWTGLEPATPGVTGRYSNQLNYHSEALTIQPTQQDKSFLKLTTILNRNAMGAERLELPTLAL